MTAKKIVIATLGAVLVAGAAIPAFAAPDRPDRGPGGKHGPHAMMRGAMMKDVTFVRLLKTADTNKDGKISKEEMAASQEALFTQIDANKDGNVTRGELVDYRIAKREEFRKNNPRPEMAENAERKDGEGPRHERADRDDRRHDGRHGEFRQARFERHGGMGGGRFFRMIDEDRDNKITKTEASAASDKLFARMDTNKDGVISIDDLPDRPL
ncbi:EF-hand domain-containing protein [Rhizobium wenxiniae]|uniref:EF-hand domain-containing protein n=1 Tax=Rhizobium wenxiniae TaxID=1737357 RepID=UPI001C6E0DC6|nr:EF-hand domain-containing protein [Rhizobium wenxiniae]MBW9092012.1 EF-hand domain-containing protein [Rhizobium wenxiniae]